MENEFEISVTYKAKELVFKAEFLPTGFSYKISVALDDRQVVFEPDEERNFRALVDMEDIASITSDEKQIIELITGELTELFRN